MVRLLVVIVALSTTAFVVIVAAFSTDTGQCFTGNFQSRCEGNTRLWCASGWLAGSEIIHEDCTAKKQFCAPTDSDNNVRHAQCVDSLGSCSAATFVSYCDPGRASIVRCIDGRMFGVGKRCTPIPMQRIPE
jgi:hypothetical protein